MECFRSSAALELLLFLCGSRPAKKIIAAAVVGEGALGMIVNAFYFCKREWVESKL